MTRADSRWPLHPLMAVGIAAIAVAVMMIGCGREAPPTSEPIATDTSALQEPVKQPPPPPRLSYRAVLIEGMESILQLQSELGIEGFSLVLKVNRRDIAHVRQGENLIVPSRIDNLLDLSPFPRTLPSVQTLPKLMLVSQEVQAYAAYEAGDLVRWGPTSTGRPETPTPNGLLFTNWKSKQRRSTVDGSWETQGSRLTRWVAGRSVYQFVAVPGAPSLKRNSRQAISDADRGTASNFALVAAGAAMARSSWLNAFCE